MIGSCCRIQICHYKNNIKIIERKYFKNRDKNLKPKLAGCYHKPFINF